MYGPNPRGALPCRSRFGRRFRAEGWEFRVTCWLVALFWSLLASTCSYADLGGASRSAASSSDSELSICYYPTENFFFYESGVWTGLEYDILSRFANEQGLELSFHAPGNLAALFGALHRGECELVAATVTRTEDRQQVMDFSPAYFPVRILVLEKKGSLTTRPEHLRGKVAAVHRESSYAEALDRIDGVKKLWVEDVAPAFRAVSDGDADFLACDSAFVLQELSSYPNLQITIAISERQYFAFAMAKGSVWTEPLAKLMDSMRAQGEIRELLLKYYDEEGVDMILDEP